jgi:hypothetical protein
LFLPAVAPKVRRQKIDKSKGNYGVATLSRVAQAAIIQASAKKRGAAETLTVAR